MRRWRFGGLTDDGAAGNGMVDSARTWAAFPSGHATEHGSSATVVDSASHPELCAEHAIQHRRSPNGRHRAAQIARCVISICGRQSCANLPDSRRSRCSSDDLPGLVQHQRRRRTPDVKAPHQFEVRLGVDLDVRYARCVGCDVRQRRAGSAAWPAEGGGELHQRRAGAEVAADVGGTHGVHRALTSPRAVRRHDGDNTDR